MCQPFWHRLRRLPRGASANLTRGFTKHLALASYRVLSALIVVLLKGGDQTAMSVDDDAGSAMRDGSEAAIAAAAGDLYVWVCVANLRCQALWVRRHRLLHRASANLALRPTHTELASYHTLSPFILCC